MFKKAIITVLALSVTTFAVADDTSIAKNPDIQTIDVRSSVADTRTGDDVSTTNVADVPRIAGVRHQKHLGLGFGHGVSNRGVSNRGSNVQSTPNAGAINPYNDNCKPNYNSDDRINPGDNGARKPNYNSDDRITGLGGFDCGDPSPSD